MEEINATIVSLLTSDGRMSFTELARRTGLSVSAAQQRVRRLEERGVIKGYSAVVSADASVIAMGRGFIIARAESGGLPRRLYAGGAWIVWPALAPRCGFKG